MEKAAGNDNSDNTPPSEAIDEDNDQGQGPEQEEGSSQQPAAPLPVQIEEENNEGAVAEHESAIYTTAYKMVSSVLIPFVAAC